MNDALTGRIRKLLALAERGVGGEATNAQTFLEATLRNNAVRGAAEPRTLDGLVGGSGSEVDHV